MLVNLVPDIEGRPAASSAARSGVGSEAFCGAALHPAGGARSRRDSSYIPRHSDVDAHHSTPRREAQAVCGPGRAGAGRGRLIGARARRR